MTVLAEQKPLPKKGRLARNRACKTHIERPLDWTNIDEIAALQDVEEFNFDADHFEQLSEILRVKLTELQRAELTELAASYRRQDRQGLPAKDDAAADLRKLAKISTKLAGLAHPDQSSLDKAEGLIHNLNGVAFNRLAIELRSQLGLGADTDLSPLIYGQRRDWLSLAAATAAAARHTNQGRYGYPSVKLCVRHLADMFKTYTGIRPTYAGKRNTDYTTVAGSQAARFVESFFRIVAPSLPPQTSASALDKLLTYRRKALRNTA